MKQETLTPEEADQLQSAAFWAYHGLGAAERPRDLLDNMVGRGLLVRVDFQPYQQSMTIERWLITNKGREALRAYLTAQETQ